MSKKILAYITNDKERVITVDGLGIYVKDEDEKQHCISDFIKAFGNAGAVKMTNGDYLIMSK